ncbi:MAG: hypothetical protein ACK5UQ_00285 [Planctomycetota bacterium]
MVFTNRSAMAFNVLRTHGCQHGLDASARQRLVERLGELRVAIDDEELLAAQEAIDRVGEVARDLRHERAVGVGGHARDVHGPGGEVDGEQHVVRHQPARSHTSAEKRSAAAIVPAWAFKNVRHEVGRSGAGAMPAAFKIFATVVLATLCPTLPSAPTILV